jgi:hypothetical protein
MRRAPLHRGDSEAYSDEAEGEQDSRREARRQGDPRGRGRGGFFPYIQKNCEKLEKNFLTICKNLTRSPNLLNLL